MSDTEDGVTAESTNGNPEAQSKVYAAYQKHRELLTKQEFECSRDFDKWNITIAGGALALSFTFLKDIVNLEQASVRGWLIVGWAVLVASVGVCLASMHIGAEAHRKFRECLDDAADGGGCGSDYWSRANAKMERCWQASSVTWLCYIALALTLIGVAALFIFVYLNAGTSKPHASAQPLPVSFASTASATDNGASATAKANGFEATATVRSAPK